MSETIHIPTAVILEVNRSILIRQWWYLYLRLLKKDLPTAQAEFGACSAECVKRGIMKAGMSMPKDGAEDLARDVDEFKRRGK